MSLNRSQDFTQDPLDVSSSPEHSFEDETKSLIEFVEKPAKREKKIVSISAPKKEDESLRGSSASQMEQEISENTPLLHPSTSLPTVVGIDELIDDYPGPSQTTRSEIGRNELVRRKKKKGYSRSKAPQKKKPRPLIISPFMPISTQVSIDARATSQPIGYGSTADNLINKDIPSDSGSDEESDVVPPDTTDRSSFFKDIFRAFYTLDSREWITISMLCLSNLCSTVAFSCIAPFYPQVAKMKELSETQTGIVFGVFEFTMFVTAPLFGKYIVSIGSKRLFTFGLAMTGITAILFGFLDFLPHGHLFFWSSVIVRILEALGDAAFVTSSFAISAKCFPNNIAFVVSLLETFAGLGYTAGPVIGGFLYDIGGFQLPFFVLGVVLLAATIGSIRLIEDHKDAADSEGKGMIAMLRIGKIWILISSVFACAISLSFLDPTLSNHLESFHMGPTEVGLMFLLCGGLYTLSSPVIGPFVDRFHCGTALSLFGTIGTIVSMLLIGPSPLLDDYVSKDLVLIGISLSILGLAASALYIPSFQSCLDTVKEFGFEDNFHTYGCVSGVFQAAFGLGSFVGPTIGSVLTETIGFSWTTTIIAGLHVVLTMFIIGHSIYSKCI